MGNSLFSVFLQYKQYCHSVVVMLMVSYCVSLQVKLREWRACIRRLSRK